MSDEKPRKSKASLDKLKANQQEQVFDFIEGHTLAASQKWLQAEYGIELSENSISQWAMKMRFKRDLTTRVELIVRARNNADQLIQEIGDSTSIDKANLVLLGQAFMDAQISGDPKAIKQLAMSYTFLIDAMAKSRRADAAVQDSDTSRRKFEFDAAKAVLKYLDELNAIRQSGAGDSEKMERVVERLFGKPPIQEGAS